MTKMQMLFLKIAAASLRGERVFCKEMTKKFWLTNSEEVSFKNLQEMIKEQALEGLISDYLLTWELENMPKLLQEVLQRQTVTSAIMYYRMTNFVFMILNFMRKERIHGCILKGVGLSAYYPKEEMRKVGDVDLYIPNLKEFESFCRILKKHGFEQQKSITDHHISFFYIQEGVRLELEVHKKPINSQTNTSFNKAVEKIFEPFSKWNKFPEVTIINGQIPVLPVEENAFYLLLHMLQHFLNGGMGIRLLCDWVVFFQKETVSSEKFLSFLKQSKIEGFAYMVTGICITFLGLSKKRVPWLEGHMPKERDMELFLKDIFDGGEFGGQDRSRMLIPIKPLSLFTYFKELHRQMRLRFHRAGRVFILWPLLWLITGIIFIYNNRHLRNTSTKEIIKSAKERSQLLESLKLFTD